MNNLMEKHMFRRCGGPTTEANESVVEIVWYGIAYFRLSLAAKEVVMGSGWRWPKVAGRPN